MTSTPCSSKETNAKAYVSSNELPHGGSTHNGSSDRYGYQFIPAYDNEFCQALKKNFYIYQEIQDEIGDPKHCGSYMHDANTKNYDPQFYQKQISLYQQAKNITNCLEIGVFDCSSALILLMANPNLKITGIDICEYECVEKAVVIINKYFNNNYTLFKGKSLDVIPKIPDNIKYDLIHIDAQHTFDAVSAEITLLLQYSKPETVLVFDDTDNKGVSSAIQYHSDILDHIYTSENKYCHSIYRYNSMIFQIQSENQINIMTQNNNPTLVTCLFDLKKIDNTDRKSIDEYLSHAEFTLSLPYNFIIYTEPELFWKIWKMRKVHKLLDKTIIITKTLESLPYYKYKDHIKLLHELNPIEGIDPKKDTPNYFVLQWSKFTFLDEAIANNPFNASHIMWIDCGIAYRANKKNYQTLNKGGYFSPFANLPDHKIKISIFNMWNLDEVSKVSSYKLNIRVIDGGYFGGNIHTLKIISKHFKQELNNALVNSFAPHEDTILAHVFIANTYLFDYSLSNSEHILNNFVVPTELLPGIIGPMLHSAVGFLEYHRKSAYIGYVVAGKMYTAWKDKKMLIPALFLEKLFEVYYILAFNFRGNILMVMTDYKEQIQSNPEFAKVYESHKDITKKNFAAVGFLLE